VNLTTLEQIVKSCMPFDTGYMFTYGSRYMENSHFLIAIYDVERVPYIIYQEMGTRFSTKNQYFIQDKTIGMINQTIAFEQRGMYFPINTDERMRQATKNLMRQGLVEQL